MLCGRLLLVSKRFQVCAVDVPCANSGSQCAYQTLGCECSRRAIEEHIVTVDVRQVCLDSAVNVVVNVNDCVSDDRLLGINGVRRLIGSGMDAWLVLALVCAIAFVVRGGARTLLLAPCNTSTSGFCLLRVTRLDKQRCTPGAVSGWSLLCQP